MLSYKKERHLKISLRYFSKSIVNIFAKILLHFVKIVDEENQNFENRLSEIRLADAGRNLIKQHTNKNSHNNTNGIKNYPKN